MTSMSKSTLASVLTVLTLPLVMGQSCVPGFPSPGATSSNDKANVSLYDNGTLVTDFPLGNWFLNQCSINVGEFTVDFGPNPLSGTKYRIEFARPVAVGAVASITILYDDPNVQPVPEVSQFAGMLTLSHLTGSSMTVNTGPGGAQAMSGLINLTRADGRLTGSFDFSIGSLRAVGEVDLPDTFHQP